MKLFKSILIIAITLFSFSIFSQENANTPANKGKERYVTYFSTGKAVLNIDKKSKVFSDDGLVDNNSELIRRLEYTAKEVNTKAVHAYTLFDGNEKQVADRKPDYCRVINTVTGKITDEFSNTKTCDVHFGDAPFRKTIDAFVQAYANKFKEDIDQFKGVLYITPSAGTKSIKFASPMQLTVTLSAEGREYKAIANLIDEDGVRKVLRTHTFIVTDVSSANPEKGLRRIIITNDYKKDTQDIISGLVKYAQEKSQIWNGKRRKFMTNKSDINSQF